MFNRLKSALLCLFIVCCAPVVAEDSIKSFVSGSYAQILNMKQGKPFVLVFWSLECVPCYKELAMLGKLSPRQFDLVLVSTDDAAADKDIRETLIKFELQTTDVWKFSNTLIERLRYEVDATWYGELPRSYLFDGQHQRQVVSGLLSHKIINAWMQEHSLGR